MDWRIKGVGGISVDASRAVVGREEKATMLAKGWLLLGDEVIVTSTGEEGLVVSIDGIKTKTDKSSDAANTGVGAETEAKKEEKKHPTDGNAMDVDTPPTAGKETEEAFEAKNKGGATPSASSSTETKLDSLVKPPSIGVKLTKSGQVQTYTLAEIEFNRSKITSLSQLPDSVLARRWECMMNTALAHSAGHDLLAMEEYTNSFYCVDNSRHAHDIEADDGTASPKSVTLYQDVHNLLPFGSGLVAAPEVVKNGPSVIPLDNLEETVRKMVYGTDTPRVRPNFL